MSKRNGYISWDEYFMGVALLASQTSKDPSTQFGACIVNDDNRIMSVGYNGFPRGCSDDEFPWEREGNKSTLTKYPYVCHAELNAILNAGGNSLKGCRIYVALFPCNECAKAIIQCGIKEVVFSISGKGAYSKLKYESGVHRVQRVPETESQGRIQTSTVTVAVLPEAVDVEINIDEKDLKIDTYRSSGAGGQHVNKTESCIRMTHLPTGIVVTCQDERSQLKNREKAMKVMKSRLYDYYNSQYQSEYAENRKNQIGTGDRSERIRTYNFPQGRITDHRIGFTAYNLDEFMLGDIDAMVEALTLADREARLAGEEE